MFHGGISTKLIAFPISALPLLHISGPLSNFFRVLYSHSERQIADYFVTNL